MLRKIAMGIVAAGLLAGLAIAFWPQDRPNILLITLDTTRADHLGCYQCASAKTPTLDSLAASGVLCERAYTVAPLTLPAHTSLFTGLYPAESGVRTNGRGRLDDSVPTLAEILQRSGYDTAAFVAAFVLDSKFGLDRGFHVYDDDVGDVDGEAESDVLHRQRDGATVIDAALNWLGRWRSQPFFCWVHLYDPHFPYLPHADLFGDEFKERPYDAEIAYVDQQVGRLVDFLKSHGLVQRTLVVVVGDHGEGLGEHIERTHGLTLYNATMQVPLIFRHPSRLPSGRRVTDDVSMVDISPTIIELLGLAEKRKITGKSMKPTLMKDSVKQVTPTKVCYGATDDPFLINGWSPLRSLTMGNWKYIKTTRPELFNLATDPNERNNLMESNSDQARSMAARLDEFESELVPRDETKVQLSASDLRALASLGYVTGSKAAVKGPAPANLPDVKDMVGLYIAADEAQELIRSGQEEAGIEQLRRIVKQAPTHTTATWALAWALWEQSKIDAPKSDETKVDETKADEAMEIFRSLLAIRPGCHEAHQGLGMMLLKRDRTDEGIAELRKAIEILPELSEAHYILAKALYKTGKLDEALFHFNAVLQTDPRHSSAYQWRAHMRARGGQIDGAIEDYRQALKFAPDSPEANFNLGGILADRGDGVEARRYLVRAVELNPRSAQLQYFLGVFLFQHRDFQQAITHLAKAVELQPEDPAAKAGLQAAQQALAKQKAGSG